MRRFKLITTILLITLSVLQAAAQADVQRTELQTDKKERERKERLERIRKDSLDGFYIPKNIDDCMSTLDKLLTKKEKKKISTSFPMDLHFGLGLYLRNNWGLWQGSRLQQYFYQLGIRHPDDMSSIILNCYWRHLRQKPIDFEKEVERHSPIPTPQLMIPKENKK